ncbi:uncharacterized protein RAG0_08601 [Rhynchosporium agropyri]|uniref:Uncharacterized protein n=1 Tax=Rhynchosporium agropyri TaxID=914238 RepID=A0A1E1KRI7_9HELO|nr:uncharacterized protein RAG0_08601 [Rhynchosporium agropyri]
MKFSVVATLLVTIAATASACTESGISRSVGCPPIGDLSLSTTTPKRKKLLLLQS